MARAAVALVLVMAALVTAEQTEAQQEAQRAVAASINGFSTDLYGVLRAQEGNLIVSPLSASAALGLVCQGAGGRTEQQLLQALGLSSDNAQVRDGFKALFQSLQTNDEAIVRIANKVYMRRGASIKEGFRRTAADSFRAEAEELDFAGDNENSRRAINSWVERITDSKIKELLTSLEQSTLLVLVNAIYFKGTWAKPFDEDETRDEPFHTSLTTQVNVPMMHRTARFGYASLPDLRARVLELPYRGHSMKMLVLLPDAKDGLPTVEAGLGQLNLTKISREMSFGEVIVTMPKFKIESKFELHNHLPKLGITDLFVPGANLTGITDLSVWVSRVVQKAFVEVTEKGTVAAAATGRHHSECIIDDDCPEDKWCFEDKCADPCLHTCPEGVSCDVYRRRPICGCPEGTTGNPYIGCFQDMHDNKDTASTVPECMVSSQCSKDKACINMKCSDPCSGTCGEGANCSVVNHNPICKCPEGLQGDPFLACRPSKHSPLLECLVSVECNKDKACVDKKCIDPCPGTCGEGSHCRVINHSPICACPEGMEGDPFVQCRPSKDEDLFVGLQKCILSADCDSTKGCLNNECRDPCPGACGVDATCQVHNHDPLCLCPEGSTGDPFVSCTNYPILVANPCMPSPCGPRTNCRVGAVGTAQCSCQEGYMGSPLTGCHPECLVSSDCDLLKICIRNRCQDPCPGTCGLNARCIVNSHYPICFCPQGSTGDPFSVCRSITDGEVIDENENANDIDSVLPNEKFAFNRPFLFILAIGNQIISTGKITHRNESEWDLFE